MRNRASVLALLLALATGCTAGGPPATPGGTKAVRSPGGPTPLPDRSPSPIGGGLVPVVPSPLASGLAPGPATGVISNNGAGLAGRVLAPAGIVANNGGSLISDRGAGIVANNGGSLAGTRPFRTLAIAQAPLAGARVYLLDAAGRPLRGADGGPLSTLADADGRYAFAGEPPAHNLIVAVELAGGKGLLQAVVPADAKGPRVVDVDAVATLATAYILDQYVAGQADPQATLDRLPGAVEAATRSKTGAALEQAGTAPAAFGSAEVVALVTGLRRRDPALDAQFEEVKRLLIVAGASDLGNGLVATDVTLGGIRALLPAPGGGLYVVCPSDRRVWELGPDGKLRTAVGRGQPSDASLDGLAGPDAGLYYIAEAALDAAGRLVLLEDPGRDPTRGLSAPGARRITRLEPDGKLRQFAVTGAWATPGDGDEVIVYQPGSDGGKLVAAGPAGEPRTLRVLTPEEAKRFEGVEGQGRDAAATYLLGGIQDPARNVVRPALYRLDRATGATALAWGGPSFAGGVGLGGVDHQGAVLQIRPLDGGDLGGPVALEAVHADGTVRVLAPRLAKAPTAMTGAFLRPDGTAYLAAGDRVYRIQDGTPVLVAGREGLATSGDARGLDIDGTALAAMPDGAIVVADALQDKVLRVDATGAVAPVGAEGAYPGVVAAAADQAGNLYLLDRRSKLTRVDARGAATVLLPGAAPEAMVLEALVVTPDGTPYVLRRTPIPPREDGVREVRDLARVGADGRLVAVADGFPDYYPRKLAIDPAGRLHVADAFGAEVHRVDGGTTTTFAAVDALGQAVDAFAVDGRGRYYYAGRGGTTIERLDPASGATAVIAGPGGRVFTGSGVDESVADPHDLAFDGQGALVFFDGGHRQIKRIPPDKLD